MMFTTYKKRVILLSVIIAALFGLVGAFMLTPKTTAKAEDSTPSNNLYWGLDEDTGVLTLSGASDGELAPYSTVTVSSVIYPAWYNDRASITSVTVTDSVYAPSSMRHWFDGCSNLTTVNLSNLDTSQVTNMGQMFRSCRSLTTLDVSNFDTSLVTDMTQMFYGCSGLTTLDLSNFDTSLVTDMDGMFSACSGLTTLDVSNFDTPLVTDMSNMFENCRGLTTLDLSNFDTSQVTYMNYMFGGCSGLTSLNISTFETSKVTYMNRMFSGCSGLTTLDVSNFETSLVTDMGYMFYGCSGLTTLDVSNFETSKVTYMNGMFSGCSGLTTLDVSNFETSLVTDMAQMFYGCSGLTTLDVSNFETSLVTDMGYMFYGCSGLTSLDLSNFDTTQVTNMSSMFRNCSGLTSLDLSAFDPTQVTDMSSMFFYCNNLDTITVGVSLAEKLSTSTNNTYLYSTPHTKWYDEDDNEYTDASRFDQGGTYITAEHTHSGGAATCLEAAICGGCGRAYGNPLGHDIVRHNPQAPTCTEKGWGMYESCSRCDYSTYEEIAALGHSFGEFVVDIQPTCTEKGSKSKHCTLCDEKSEVTEIDALGHTLNHNPAAPATNDKEGNIEFWDCEDCNRFFADEDGKEEITDRTSVIIPKLVDPIADGGLSGTDILWITLIVVLGTAILIEVAVIVYRAKRKTKNKK